MEVQTNPALVLIGGRGGNLRGGGSGQNWRKRVGVEPTDDRSACHPPVLKITQGLLMRLENSLFYLMRKPVPRLAFRPVLTGIELF